MTESAEQQPIAGSRALPQEFVVLRPYQGGDSDDIDLLRLLKGLRKWLKVIVPMVILTTAAATLIVFYLPLIYKSEAVITSTSSRGDSALARVMGDLSLPLDLPFAADGTQGEEILNFLRSRTLRMRLVEKYDLLPVLFAKKWDPEAKRWLVGDKEEQPTVLGGTEELNELFEVELDKKSGLITVSWLSEDPQFSRDMVARAIEELKLYLDHEYTTEAARTREFVEAQLGKAIADLQIWERKVPDKFTTLSEIMRERESAALVYQELRKQLELAKIAEAKEMIQFKVLDEPFLPEKHFKPHRALIVGMIFMAIMIFSIFSAFALEFLVKREG